MTTVPERDCCPTTIDTEHFDDCPGLWSIAATSEAALRQELDDVARRLGPRPRPTEAEALKQRPGDQPLPVVNDRRDIQSMVIEDITARRQVGIQRYGTALQAHNGRDMLRDAYEEVLDLAVYLRGVIEERDHPAVQELAAVAAPRCVWCPCTLFVPTELDPEVCACLHLDDDHEGGVR